MFLVVRGWRSSNKAKYIGNSKVEGSFHGGRDFFSFIFQGFWPVAVGKNSISVPDLRREG
jgi:hypothetical protein